MDMDQTLASRASAGFMTILWHGNVRSRLCFDWADRAQLFPAEARPGTLHCRGCLVLGVRHSTDTDHVVAISTIVKGSAVSGGAALIGGFGDSAKADDLCRRRCLIILCGVIIPRAWAYPWNSASGSCLILLGFLNLSG